MANNDVIVKELAPIIDKALANKDTVIKLKNLIHSYIDANVNKLTTTGPIYRTIFADAEFHKFYTILGIDPENVKAMLKRSTYIQSQWQIMNNPFNSCITLCIRYFRMKKQDDMRIMALSYLTLSMYPSLHFKYFKYEPNERIMDYTINNLSNKFKIKQLGTIYHALLETTTTSDNTYYKNLIRCTDKDVTDYVQAIKTRLNSMLRKIAEEFYKNEKEKNYMNIETDNNDEDDYKVSDNNTLVIDRVTEATVSNLTVNGPNMVIVKMAAKLADISVNELRNTTNSLLGHKDNTEEIRKLVSSILFLFIFEDKHTKEQIGSNDFLVYAIELYKKSNTNDKNIIEIKDVLDKWLNKYSDAYKKTQRVATINNFRRALFLFFIISIQYNAK